MSLYKAGSSSRSALTHPAPCLRPLVYADRTDEKRLAASTTATLMLHYITSSQMSGIVIWSTVTCLFSLPDPLHRATSCRCGGELPCHCQTYTRSLAERRRLNEGFLIGLPSAY